MSRKVQLFANEFISDKKPLISSQQGQVFFGKCAKTGERIVVKQINISYSANSLIKELQVFDIFLQFMAQMVPNEQDIKPDSGDEERKESKDDQKLI
jgi:hypothetical protein